MGIAALWIWSFYSEPTLVAHRLQGANATPFLTVDLQNTGSVRLCHLEDCHTQLGLNTLGPPN